MVADFEEYGVRTQTDAFDRGATVEECPVAALDVFTDQGMRGDDLDTTVAVAKILRCPGGLPMAVVIDHEHVAAGFDIAGKDLIGRHDKKLFETWDGREHLSPERARVLRAIARPVRQVRPRSCCNDDHVRCQLSKQSATAASR